MKRGIIMINIERQPTVTIEEIEKELRNRGKIYQDYCPLRRILFNNDYMNNSYISLLIADDVYNNYVNPDEGSIAQAVVEMLREVCPNDEYVLVDVSW